MKKALKIINDFCQQADEILKYSDTTDRMETFRQKFKSLLKNTEISFENILFSRGADELLGQNFAVYDELRDYNAECYREDILGYKNFMKELGDNITLNPKTYLDPIRKELSLLNQNA